jgi:hypothetical protein
MRLSQPEKANCIKDVTGQEGSLRNAVTPMRYGCTHREFELFCAGPLARFGHEVAFEPTSLGNSIIIFTKTESRPLTNPVYSVFRGTPPDCRGKHCSQEAGKFIRKTAVGRLSSASPTIQDRCPASPSSASPVRLWERAMHKGTSGEGLQRVSSGSDQKGAGLES